MDTPTKWWLICEEDVQEIRAFLLASTEDGDPVIEQQARDAMHTLDTGLNTTDAVPDDFKVKPED